MTLFYDPKKKQPQPWVKVIFILIPLILILLALTFGKKRFESELDNKGVDENIDIFDKI